MNMKFNKKLFARLTSAALIIVMIFSFAACKKDEGKTPESEIKLPDKKVAILVAPEAQYPEDYKAAAELANEYSGKVIVKEYSDSRVLKAGDPQIMTLSKELAEDSEIGAIIYARATQFTSNAVNAAKSINPSLVTVCIEPEESIEKLAEISDLVLCADWSKAASDIVSAAKEQGAKYFVVFSHNRHLSENPMIAAENAAIKAACADQGLTYVYESSYDPIYSGGIKTAKQFIKEAVTRLTANKKIEGSDVALFSTDSSVQSTIVEVAESNGMIYVCPSFPTAYNGLGEAYEIAMPEKINDVDKYLAAAKTALKDSKGRFSAYKFPLASTMLRGALHCTFDLLNATATSENLSEKVTERLTAAAANDAFTVSAYDSALNNVFAAYCPGFEKIK